MQPTLAAPRASLDANRVLALLLTNPVIEISYGARWLDSRLNQLGDLTPFMSEGSSIASDTTATVHRSCTLMLDSDAPINYVTDFVQPYMIATNKDTGFAAPFNLGVYTLTTPSHDLSALPAVLSLPGYDLLYFLNQAVGDSYQILAGANPITAAVTFLGDAFPGATVDVDDTTAVLAADFVWAFGQPDPVTGGTITWLTMINDLLQAAGYLPLWVDWDGVFQMHPYTSPQNSPVEQIFDLTSPSNIVASARTVSQDLFDVPNKWRFTTQNLTSAPLEGDTQFTYIDTDPNNPGSFPNRGRFIYKVGSFAVTDFLSLEVASIQQIETDLAPAETFTFTTSPFPLAWHRDILSLLDPNLATVGPSFSPERKIMALQWSLPLDGTSDMSWTCQTCSI